MKMDKASHNPIKSCHGGSGFRPLQFTFQSIFSLQKLDLKLISLVRLNQILV